jgi:hypothetical protein
MSAGVIACAIVAICCPASFRLVPFFHELIAAMM